MTGEFVPDAWKLVRVSDLCRLQRGFDITEATRAPGTVPVYSSSGISYYHSTAAVRPPGLVTGRKGLLGRVFLVNEPFWPHDTTLWADTFNGNEPRFVAFVLESFRLERLDAATSVPTLNRNNLAAYHVAIPADRAEQERISSAVADADFAIRAVERLIAKMRGIKRGMMQELLTGSTRLPGFAGKRKVVKLGQLGSFMKGRGIKRDDVRSSGIPCIRYGELYTAFSDYTDHTLSFVEAVVAATAQPLRSGDLLFAGSGETKEEIGMCVAYVGPIPAVAGGDTIILRGSGYDPVYLASLMNTPAIAKRKASAGQGDAVVHISASALAAIEFDLPPLDEQRAIGEAIQDANAEIATLERRLKSARAVKTGMMQELLTGRTRLPVEAAS